MSPDILGSRLQKQQNPKIGTKRLLKHNLFSLWEELSQDFDVEDDDDSIYHMEKIVYYSFTVTRRPFHSELLDNHSKEDIMWHNYHN